jgi:hypothetical protein
MAVTMAVAPPYLSREGGIWDLASGHGMVVHRLGVAMLSPVTASWVSSDKLSGVAPYCRVTL